MQIENLWYLNSALKELRYNKRLDIINSLKSEHHNEITNSSAASGAPRRALAAKALNNC